jgi:LacI family transcriptional regulator
LKLEVPADLSIVGFDDTPLASTVWPGLTTIRQPIKKLTERALELLVEDIRRRRSGKPGLQRQEVVKLSLVKRKSAARIPR